MKMDGPGISKIAPLPNVIIKLYVFLRFSVHILCDLLAYSSESVNDFGREFCLFDHFLYVLGQ